MLFTGKEVNGYTNEKNDRDSRGGRRVKGAKLGGGEGKRLPDDDLHPASARLEINSDCRVILKHWHYPRQRDGTPWTVSLSAETHSLCR